MKIIILSDDFPPEVSGGAGIVAYRVARGLLEAGNAVSVITTTRNIKDEGISTFEGLMVYKIHSEYHEKWRAYISLYNPAAIRKVKEIFCKEQPDVIHAHNIHHYISYRVLPLARKFSKKVFLTAHDVMSVNYGKAFPIDDFADPDKEIKYKVSFFDTVKKYQTRVNPLRNIIIRYFLGYTDKIFAVSFALKKVLEGGGIKNIEVIHNGIDLKQWVADNQLIARLKDTYGLSGKKVVLFGGRISAAKGGIRVLEAMNKVVQVIPEAVLVVLGRKDETDRVFGELQYAELADKVICPGWISGSELTSFYFSSDLVVVPSVCFDSFPNANLEAMACHKPLVSTCFGGSREAVLDGKTGFIVNPNDVTSMADNIMRILTNDELAQRFGEAGWGKVKNEFTIGRQIDKTLFWYKK
jgi:glycosyltransferase involved in cell wall biosynthesis